MIYLVIGRRELGKTTLVYHMASRVPQRLIFDPRGLIRHGVKATTRQQLDDAMAALEDSEISEVSHTPMGDVQEGFGDFAREVQRWVNASPDRPLAVVVDEVSFVDTRIAPFMWTLRCSRRDVVQILMTGHRPSDFKTDVRAIADHWLLFGCRQEHDLDVIRERCGPGVVSVVEKLQPRTFVHWDDALGTFKVFNDPSAWYVPLAPSSGPRHAGPRTVGLDDLPSESGPLTAKPVDSALPFD